MKIVCSLTEEHEEEVESEREGETDREAYCLRERNAEEPGLVEQRQRLEHCNSWNRTADSPYISSGLFLKRLLPEC